MIDVRAAFAHRVRATGAARGTMPAVVLMLGALAATTAWLTAQSLEQSTPRARESIPFHTTVPDVAVLPPVPPASAAASVVPTTGTAAPASSFTTPATTPITTPASSFATPATTPTTPATTPTTPATTPTAPAVPVVALQTVPAVRDLIVEIGGVQYSSDSAGAIDVDDADPTADVVIIGVLAEPPIRQVEFLGWADGSGIGPRNLQTLAGPVAPIPLALSSRVTVALASGSSAPAIVEFHTEVGEVRVAIETPTWLIDQRAVRSDAGLAVQQFHYVVSAVITPTGTEAAEHQVFVASPEARWVVGAG